MTRAQISVDRVREIIKEEIVTVREQVDHNAIKDIVTGASKLLAAIEDFRETAPPSAINATTPFLSQLDRVLEDMVSTPGSYVMKPKVEPKKVSLKPVKQTEAVKLKEATGERREVVNASNFQHLELGNTYVCSVGRERVKCVFKGWVDKQGNNTESVDPEEVDLLFADVADGLEWTAYFSSGKYCAGTSADPLYVKEAW